MDRSSRLAAEATIVVSMSIFGFDHSTLQAMQALTDHADAIQRYYDHHPALQALTDHADAIQRYYDHHPALQALTDHADAIQRYYDHHPALQALTDHADAIQRYYDHHPALQALTDHADAIQRYYDHHPALQALTDHADAIQRYYDHHPALQALTDHADAIQRYYDHHPALQALTDHADAIQRYYDHHPALQALTDHADAIQRYYDHHPALQALTDHADAIQRYYDHHPALQDALPTLGTGRCLEGLSLGEAEAHDPAPELSSTGREDALNGAPDPTAEMLDMLETLAELATWIDIAALLGQLREAGLDILDAGWLAVARQIDECLGWLMVTATSDGVCWNCGEPALPRSGVVCSECVVLVGEMVLEMRLLVEGL